VKRTDFLKAQQLKLTELQDTLVTAINSSLQEETVRQRKREQLIRVRIALTKISEEPSIYGFCEVCDEAISQKRLNTIPEATRCVHCQEDAERHARSRRTSTGAFERAAVDPEVLEVAVVNTEC